MSAPWVFICPSSRGIGHAVTRRLLQSTSLPILATTRSSDNAAAKASILADLPGAEDLAPRLSLVRCDVTDESSVAEAASLAADLFPSKTHHLRLACALPGILHPEKNLRQIDADKTLNMFRVNTIGPLLLFKHFADMLPRRSSLNGSASSSSGGGGGGGGLQASPEDDELRMPPHATWLTMSARVGSITDNRSGGWYSYRASKTAASSLATSFDIWLRPRSGDAAMSVAYHPGTVKTDFSREFWAGVEEGKLFSPEFAAERLLSVATGLRLEQRGKTWDWDNKQVPP
jgi:NAD(P)-dependent dehydrogenase (short-subunit alcohol dehydrogenase family)